MFVRGVFKATLITLCFIFTKT